MIDDGSRLFLSAAPGISSGGDLPQILLEYPESEVSVCPFGVRMYGILSIQHLVGAEKSCRKYVHL